MNSRAPLLFTAILLVAACANAPSEQADDRASAATPPAFSGQSYHCESGEVIVASFPSTDSAKVQYKGNSYTLRIAVSGSGARYVGDGLEWWTKGTGAGAEGALFRHMADGTSGEIIEQCTAS